LGPVKKPRMMAEARAWGFLEGTLRGVVGVGICVIRFT